MTEYILEGTARLDTTEWRKRLTMVGEPMTRWRNMDSRPVRLELRLSEPRENRDCDEQRAVYFDQHPEYDRETGDELPRPRVAMRFLPPQILIIELAPGEEVDIPSEHDIAVQPTVCSHERHRLNPGRGRRVVPATNCRIPAHRSEWRMVGNTQLRRVDAEPPVPIHPAIAGPVAPPLVARAREKKAASK